MTAVLHMLLGAALVSIGVLAAALADRLRTPADRPHNLPRVRAARATTPKQKPVIDVLAPGADDVIDALVAAGYKKDRARAAVAAIAPRDQATPEIWTAAALRHCAQGGVS